MITVGVIICFRDSDGHAKTNIPHKIIRHSPTGIEWGYGGSGPADFALNILVLFVGQEVAEKHYQDFKLAFVSNLPHEGGVIKKNAIENWITNQIETGGFKAKEVNRQ